MTASRRSFIRATVLLAAGAPFVPACVPKNAPKALSLPALFAQLREIKKIRGPSENIQILMDRMAADHFKKRYVRTMVYYYRHKYRLHRWEKSQGIQCP